MLSAYPSVLSNIGIRPAYDDWQSHAIEEDAQSMNPNNGQPSPGGTASAEPTELNAAESPPLPGEPAPMPRSFAGSGVFFGRFGLRAGYSIAIWLLLALAVYFMASIFAIAATNHLQEIRAARAFAQAHPNLPRPALHIQLFPLFVMVSDGVSFLGLLGVCWFFSRGERRPLRVYGIGRYRFADLFTGTLWGLAMMSLLVLVLHATHVLIFDGRALHGPAVLSYGIKWLLAFLLVGLSEEYSFRGYLQYTLMRGVWGLAERLSATNVRPVAFWIAAIFLSLVFALAHTTNGGETLFGLAQVFLAGIVFAYALWRTGSLWWGIGFHMAWDWAQSFLFGVPDSGTISMGHFANTHPAGNKWLSGGADGPEGSVFATVALLATILVIHFVHPGLQPALEPESEAATEFHKFLA